MRICHVAMGDLWAGAEVHLAILARELVKKPKVELFTVLLNEGRLAQELRLLGAPVAIFPEERWSTIKIFKELAAYCHIHRFDLLHTHKYKDNIIGTFAAIATRIPFVVRTVHGLPEPFRGMKAWRIAAYQSLDRVLLKRHTSRIIAVSSDMERSLGETYDSAKIVRIHNGIHMPALEQARCRDIIRKALGVHAGQYLIGTVGRLMPVKGQEHFLACAHRLLRTRDDLRFIIVGDGPLFGYLKQLAMTLKIDKHIAFLGHREDVDDLLRAMDLFVLPSLHEGIPIVLLEAMALGKPIIASRVGGIPEVVQEGVNGLLVSPAAPDELATVCIKLLTDRDLAKQYGEAAQRRVDREFSAKSMAAHTYNLYRELLEGQAAVLPPAKA